MENFKQIAEDCLAGKLSGVFILRNGGSWKSNTLSRYSIEGRVIPDYYVIGKGIVLDSNGLNMKIKERVQHFIPDMKKEQITIDIPEGKVPVMEQTENGVVITWEEKELTYTEISDKLRNSSECIHSSLINSASRAFYKKVEVLRKLTNIRNYFGKPKHEEWFIVPDSSNSNFRAYRKVNPQFQLHHATVFFDSMEHAEQAIKMLGDELKYLFEPW
jgi:hypothetical protein